MEGERTGRELQFNSEFSFLKLQPYGNEHVEPRKNTLLKGAAAKVLLQKVSFREVLGSPCMDIKRAVWEEKFVSGVTND